ncbi:MAG: hypothetical protein VCB78_08410, partial [Myxococcota bacterium]
LGTGATAEANTALGAESRALLADSTAVGDTAHADGDGSTALGMGSRALGTDATAVGSGAKATGDGAIAIGGNPPLAAALNSIALGSASLGTGATTVEAGATGSVAIGAGAFVQANAPNSVALGQDSVANAANTVSIGQPLNERRITNMADGINSMDGVNVRQLKAVEQIIYEERNELRAGIAAAVSLVTLTPSAPGKTVINVGWGNYRSENAAGLTIAHRLRIWEEEVAPGTSLMLNAGAAIGSDNNPVFRAGASFEF